MKRVPVYPRPDWQVSLDKIGFYYHTVDDETWQNNACYVFNTAQINLLKNATRTLHDMYLYACSTIVKQGNYEQFGLSDLQASLIEQSWQAQAPTLCGRFDLSYDGKHPPILRRYQADSATDLFEASIMQQQWHLEHQANILPADAEQFNYLHDQLLQAWSEIAQRINMPSFTKQPTDTLCQDNNVSDGWQATTLYFSADSDALAEFNTCRYLQDTAIEAGLSTGFVDIIDIGVHTAQPYFMDAEQQPIEYLIKIYPWACLTNDKFSNHIAKAQTRWLEPAWKLLLSHPAMLAILWELFPDHPYLLPCYFKAEKFGTINHPIACHQPSRYFTQQCSAIYQAYQPLAQFDDGYGNTLNTAIATWMIGHDVAGLSVHESANSPHNNLTKFVPHLILD